MGLFRALSGGKSPAPRATRLALEPLEPRLLLSANLTVVDQRDFGGGFIVTFYDSESLNGVTVPNIVWSPAAPDATTDVYVQVSGRTVTAIQLLGRGNGVQDLGILVEGNDRLGSVIDLRTTALDPIGFVASEGPINLVNLKSAITGADLNGFTTPGGIVLPDDLDEDGVTDDLTAVLTASTLGSVLAAGVVNGDLMASDGVNLVQVLGGDLNGEVTTWGVLGSVLVTARAVAGNLVGGDINGCINGDGGVRLVSATGGNVNGDVVSQTFVTSVIATAMVDPTTRLLVGGSVEGSVLSAGTIGLVSAAGGNVGNPALCAVDGLSVGTVRATAMFQPATGTRVGGAVGADVTAARDITLVSASTSITGTISAGLRLGSVTVSNGSLLGSVVGGTGVGRVVVSGALEGAVIRSCGPIDLVQAASMTSSTISSALRIGSVLIRGNVDTSLILAGYDVGEDLALGTADDNELTQGNVHAGTLNVLSVGGTLSGTVVAVGIGPGPDYDFYTQGDNQVAWGESRIGTATVRGTVGPNALVLVDTAVGFASANLLREPDPNAVLFIIDAGGPALGGLNQFGEINGVRQVSIPDGDGDTLRISFFGPGSGSFDPVSGELILVDPRNSTLQLTVVRGAGPGANGLYDGAPIWVQGGDDGSLALLSFGRGIPLGNTSTPGWAVDLDGAVGTLSAYQIENNEVLSASGGIRLFNYLGTTPVEDLQVQAYGGPITTFLAAGALTANVGDPLLLADSFGLVSVRGGLDADVWAQLGGVSTIAVSGGDFNGDVCTWGPVNALTVIGGNLTGTIDVLGRLGFLQCTATALGGGTMSAALTAGDLGTLLAQTLDGAALKVGAWGALQVAGAVANSLLWANGALGFASIGGTLTDSALLAASINALTVRGAVATSEIKTWGRLGAATFGGDVTNTTIEAGTIGSVVIRGALSQDDSDGDADVIEADAGRYLLRVGAQAFTIDEFNPQTIGGVLCSVD